MASSWNNSVSQKLDLNTTNLQQQIHVGAQIRFFINTMSASAKSKMLTLSAFTDNILCFPYHIHSCRHDHSF